jgi:hypothetical protein
MSRSTKRHAGRSRVLFKGYRAFSSEIRRQRREADHSCPTTAEVKNTWSYSSTPIDRRLYAMARAKFTFQPTLFPRARSGPVVEALRHKPEGRGFDPRWYQWNFYRRNPSGSPMTLGLTQSLTEIEYQESLLSARRGRCVGLTSLPPSSANCLQIWKPQTPGALRVCPGLAITFCIIPCHINATHDLQYSPIQAKSQL